MINRTLFVSLILLINSAFAQNWVQDLSKAEQQNLMGADVPEKGAFALDNQSEDLSDLPSFHDWRNHNGANYMSPVRNQGKCGSCVIFASVGALEGQFNIANDWPTLDLDLSEQQMLACSGGDCHGWYTGFGPTHLMNKGIIAESYYPYISGSIGEDLQCVEFPEARIFKAKSYDYVGNKTNMDYTHGIFEVIPVTKRQVVEALLKGPLVTSMSVYADFIGYHGGVYAHTEGDLLGGHAVVIVGYSLEENYWIVRNSWGSEWGEEGYFRIAMSDEDSSIGQYNYLYRVEPFEGGHVSLLNLPERSVFDDRQPIKVESTYKSTLSTQLVLYKDGQKVARFWANVKDGILGLFSKDTIKSYQVNPNWKRFEDGLYTLKAESVVFDHGFKKKYSQPYEILIVHNKPQMDIEIVDVLQDDLSVDISEPITERVYIKMALSYDNVPPQRVDVVLEHESGKTTIIRNRKPAETIYVSWRTTLKEDGRYRVYARAVTGQFITESGSFDIVVKNEQ